MTTHCGGCGAPIRARQTRCARCGAAVGGADLLRLEILASCITLAVVLVAAAAWVVLGA